MFGGRRAESRFQHCFVLFGLWQKAVMVPVPHPPTLVRPLPFTQFTKSNAHPCQKGPHRQK